jgi:hypothetical protein
MVRGFKIVVKFFTMQKYLGMRRCTSVNPAQDKQVKTPGCRKQDVDQESDRKVKFPGMTKKIFLAGITYCCDTADY